MTTLLVINPHCRNGDTDFVEEVVEELSAAGPVSQYRIGSSEKLAARIDDLGEALARIVVAGGDGTLNNVLPDVLEAGVPLGVLPLGTANDFARSLELPKDPAAAAALIAGGATRTVDVGVVNGHYFLNAVGVGLGPELTKKMDREKKKRLGVLAYLQSLVEVVGQRKRQYATIDVDGESVRTPFMQITIANGRHYGGGLMVSDEVEMDDGLLHVLCVRPLKPLQLALKGLRIRFGATRDVEKLIYLKGKRVSVETRRRHDATADGELVTKTPLECRSLARSLQVYVAPAQAEQGPQPTNRDEGAAAAAPLRQAVG